MLTICNSITEISRERFLANGEIVIPSFKLELYNALYSYNCLVIIPNYKNKRLRLVFEFVDGIRLSTPNAELYWDALEQILSENKNKDIEVQDYYTVLERLYEDRCYDYEYKAIMLPDEILSSINNLVHSIGGNMYTDSNDIEKFYSFKTLEDVANNIGNSSIFILNLKQLSNNSEVCGVGKRIVYSEDMYDTSNLTLAELNKYTVNMYSDSITLQQIIEKPELSQGQKDLIKKTRCTCGAELIIRMTDKGYTSISCINFHCKHKIIWSLASFIKDIGIVGCGGISLTDSINSIWLTKVLKYGKSEIDYYDVLDYEYANMLSGALSDKYKEFLDTLAEYNGSIKNLINLCNLPYVGEYASNFINKAELNSIEDFEDFITLCSKNSIKDLRVAYSLYNYLDDIYAVLDFSKAIDLSKSAVFKIAITKSIKLKKGNGESISYKNKKDFVNILNEDLAEKYPDRNMVIELQDRVTAQTQALIQDESANTGKSAKARSLGIPVITSTEFVKIIRENEGVLFGNLQ